jgi:hypothetical protein
VGLAGTPDGGGYWILGKDGGVFSFGDATFYGSTGNLKLNSPALQMVADPNGGGYWFAAGDGGVFSFGSAPFVGSAGDLTLNASVVGMAATPDGGGYWLVGSDGGVFSYGDASFYGSTGGLHLNAPIVGMAATPDGRGYWLLAADGGVFSFGDAAFYGTTLNPLYQELGTRAVSIVPTPDGGGYWVLLADGSVEPFGDASAAGIPVFGQSAAAGLDLPSGLGRATPGSFDLSPDPKGDVSLIQWGSWGGPTATGQGYALDILAGEGFNQGYQEPATIVASDLATCNGVPTYEEVEWYFPQEGQTADAPAFTSQNLCNAPIVPV